MNKDNCVILFEDGLTGKVVQSIDTDFITELDSIELVLKDIFETFYFGNGHTLIIKFGYRPSN